MVPATPTSVEHFMLTLLALIVIVICGGCIYAFIHAIFLFIFSQGDEEKKKSAWNGIRYMIIGVMLTIFLLTFFPILFEQLNVTWYATYTASNIFKRVGEILNSLLQLGSLVRETQTGNPTGIDSYGNYSL